VGASSWNHSAFCQAVYREEDVDVPRSQKLVITVVNRRFLIDPVREGGLSVMAIFQQLRKAESTLTGPQNCSLLTSFLPWLLPIMPGYQICQPWRKPMEDFAELMQRLLEIQSGGRKRSPELIAEDERLMDGLQKRNLAGKPAQRVELSQDSSERVRFKA
jgi:hypothetical protein